MAELTIPTVDNYDPKKYKLATNPITGDTLVVKIGYSAVTPAQIISAGQAFWKASLDAVGYIPAKEVVKPGTEVG